MPSTRKMNMDIKSYFIPFFTSCLVFFTACSSDNDGIAPVIDEQEQPETIVVSLNPDGDFNVTNEATTRGTATNDLYAINVYYDKNSDGNINTHYAYGLFDNKEDMVITLLARHKYKFECTLVKDGKNSLFYGQAFNNSYPGYAYPFQTNNTGSTQLKNQFITGESVYFSGLGNGKAHVKSVSAPSAGNADSYASVNRFYGETTDYEPVVGGKVSIYLKRTVFGAKFVITGVTEGTLTADCKIGSTAIWSKTTTADDEGSAKIYSYADVYDCWKNESNLSATVTISYDSNRTDWWDINKSQTMTFKRNVLTTVYINVSPDLSSATFNMQEEAFDEDNNIDLYLTSDGYIDIVVDPNEEP